MNQFFLDYGEYIVGIPALLVGVIVSFWIFNKQKSRKSLVYTILSNYFLINVDREYKSQIKILYKKKHVENVKLIVLKFKNNGNVPVKSEDFVEPIKIVFNDDVEIFTSDILSKIPEDLNISIEQNKTELKVLSTLLNPREEFEIQILISGIDASFNIKSRIVGISKIFLDKGNPLTKYLKFAIIATSIMLFSVLAFIFEFLNVYMFLIVYLLSLFTVFLLFLLDKNCITLNLKNQEKN